MTDMKCRYGTYLTEKAKCDHLLNKFDDYFKKLEKHAKMDWHLKDKMIKPMQMLLQYPMFLEELHKICEKLGEEENANSFKIALNISKDIGQNANAVMPAGRIKNLPCMLDSLGVLLSRNNSIIKLNTDDC